MAAPPDRLEDEGLRATLRRVGLRATAPRIATLTAVQTHPHSDVEALTGYVRDALGRVSTQAVYDVLGALVRVGLIRRIEPAGSPARYETRTGDNHHHLVCRSCGAIVDIDCVAGDAPCLTASHDWAFVIDEVEITFWGICPTCRAEQENRHEHSGPRTPSTRSTRP